MISNRGYRQEAVHKIQALEAEVKVLKQKNVTLEARVEELEEEVTAIQAPNVTRLPHKGKVK